MSGSKRGSAGNKVTYDLLKYLHETNLCVHVGSLYLTGTQSQPLIQSDKQPQTQTREQNMTDSIPLQVKSLIPSCADGDLTEKTKLRPVDRILALSASLPDAQILRGTPAVSVVISVRNGQDYLHQCLYSLLTQAQKCSFEIILVDDGSTDSTVEIAEDVQRRVVEGAFSLNPGVSMKIVRSAPIGLASALDLGISLSQSKYIARMDADDICESRRLGRQYHYLETHRDIHVVGGQAVVFTDTDSTHSSTHSTAFKEGCGTVAGMFPTHPVLVHWGMFFRCCLIHPAVMFRKDIVESCGGYAGTYIRMDMGTASRDCSTNSAAGSEGVTDIGVESEGAEVSEQDLIEDYSLWKRVLLRYPLSISNLPCVVLQLRKHRESKSATQAAALTKASATLRWDLVSWLKLGKEIPSSANSNGVRLSYAKQCVTKKTLDKLVHPETHLASSKDHSDAMVLLSLMYDKYLHFVKFHGGESKGRDPQLISADIAYVTCIKVDMVAVSEEEEIEVGDGEEGSVEDRLEGRDWQDEEMLTALLRDMMLMTAKRVCRTAAALSRKTIATTIPAAVAPISETSYPIEIDPLIGDGEKTRAEVSDTGLTWRDFYSEEDLKTIQNLSVQDLISSLTTML